MELFLNILWLLVALGILGAWRVRWVRHGHDNRHHAVAEWTAIGSALVLLFFAISLSDDLHQDLVIFSESSTSRRHFVIRVSAPDSSNNSGTVAPLGVHLGLAVLPHAANRASLILIARVIPLRDGSASLAQICRLSGRAPPVPSV
jgi:hypothetical protein